MPTQTDNHTDEGARAAQDAREGQGHEQLRGRNADVLPPLLANGDHQDDHRCIVEEGRDHHNRDHEAQLPRGDVGGPPEEFRHVPV